MLKILRKHRKWLLVVGGSILLVIFLVQGTISQWSPDPMKQVAGTIGHDQAPVRVRDLELASREFEALKELIPQYFVRRMGIASRDHWFLLTHEAKAAGMVGHAKDGGEWAPELARIEAFLTFRELSPEQRQKLMQESGGMEGLVSRVQAVLERARAGQLRLAGQLRPAELDAALSKLHGVERLVVAYTSASRFSDRRAVVQSKRLLDGAIVDVVIVPATALAAKAPEPTPEELSAQFEKYKGEAPGDAPGEFGYRLPARVKLEWLTLDRALISPAVKLDPVEVYRHWQNNRAQYAGEFAAEQAKVEQALRATKTSELLSEIDRQVKAKVRAATRRLASDGPYKKLPPDWEAQRPKLVDLAASIADVAKQEGVEIAPPAVTVKADAFVPVDELSTLPGIGRSFFQAAANFGTFTDLVESARELEARGAFEVQAMVPAANTPLFDMAGNRYYVNILEAVPSSPAASIDEVRSAVVRDCKLKWAYDQIAARGPELEAKAVLEGLAAVAAEFPIMPEAGGEGVPLEVQKLRQVFRARGDSRTPEFNDENLRDAVLARVAALDPAFIATPENADVRTMAVPVPTYLSLAVIQLAVQRQMAVENRYQWTASALHDLRQYEYAMAVPDPSGPFTEKNLAERLGFRLMENRGRDPGEQPAPQPN